LKCQNCDDGDFHIFRGIEIVVVRVPSWGGNIKAQFSKSMKLYFHILSSL
jgi:hypothetical protein